MKRLLATIALGLSWAGTASAACTVLAASDEPGEPAVILSPDEMLDGVVVVVDGRIAAVGRPPFRELTIAGVGPEVTYSWSGSECDLIDTMGATVTPGLVAVGTQLGLVEVEMEQASVDSRADGDSVRSAFVALDAYNADSSLIPIQRVEGVTSSVVFPQGGRVAGQAGWVDLDGRLASEAVVERSVAMVASLGGTSRALSLMELRELFAEARVYSRNKAGYDARKTRPDFSASRLDIAALEQVLKGEIPLFVSANRTTEIEALLRLKSELGIELIIGGAAEGWKVKDALAEAAVPVVVDVLANSPAGFDQMQARSDNAALLAAAGVPVIIGVYDTHNARRARIRAGNAVRAGMPYTDALRAITTTPSDVFGVGDRGRIEVGAQANLVVWSGDPLEPMTSVRAVLIGGKRISMETRQTRLVERYRTLPGTPVPPLDLPE